MAAFLGVLEVCEQTAVVVEDSVQVHEVCKDAPVADARYMLAVLLGLLLLWPDVSEMSVGSVSLKRRVANTEAKQEALETEFAGLQQVVQLQANQQVTQRFELQPMYVNWHDPKTLQPIAESPSPPPVAERDQMRIRILDLWAKLQLFDYRFAMRERQLGRGEWFHASWPDLVAQKWPTTVGLGVVSTEEQARVFTENFSQSLDAIGSVRNAIAHGVHVADEDLETAYGLAVSLEAWLNERFQVHGAALKEFESDGPKDVGPRIQPPGEHNGRD